MAILTNPCAISLHLHITAAQDKRELLLEFLSQTKPYYEQPGGVRMRLLENTEDPNSFLEVFEYDTIEAHQADERRVNADPEMRRVLAIWRGLLAGPPAVRVYQDVTSELDISG